MGVPVRSASQPSQGLYARGKRTARLRSGCWATPGEARRGCSPPLDAGATHLCQQFGREVLCRGQRAGRRTIWPLLRCSLRPGPQRCPVRVRRVVRPAPSDAHRRRRKRTQRHERGRATGEAVAHPLLEGSTPRTDSAPPGALCQEADARHCAPGRRALTLNRQDASLRDEVLPGGSTVVRTPVEREDGAGSVRGTSRYMT